MAAPNSTNPRFGGPNAAGGGANGAVVQMYSNPKLPVLSSQPGCHVELVETSRVLTLDSKLIVPQEE